MRARVKPRHGPAVSADAHLPRVPGAAVQRVRGPGAPDTREAPRQAWSEDPVERRRELVAGIRAILAAYAIEMATRPQTLYGLADSPAALAA